MASRRKAGRAVKSTVGKGRLLSSMNETRTMGPIAIAKQREKATLRNNQASEGNYSITIAALSISHPLIALRPQPPA